MKSFVSLSFPFVFILLCLKYTKCSINNENRDTILEQSVEDFKRMCPFTDLCFSSARDNFTRRDEGAQSCSCKPCECDVNCGNACCPDKPERFLNEIEVLELKSVPQQCIYAQIRPFSLTKINGRQFNMIGNCPAGYINEDVKVKCIRGYHEFDFEKDDIETLMPVSSEIRNVTFKNYFCAICHDAVQTKLHFWDTKAVCKNEKKLLLSNIFEIPLKLSEESLCQVTFVPSTKTSMYSVNYCEGIIDKCNVTGTWMQYDHALESACLSYTSIYGEFKNLHCFLCNGNTFREVDTVCQSGHNRGDDSFIALLDFNNLEGPSLKNKDTTCSVDSKYDPVQRRCRRLSCANGMILSKVRCIPLYKETDLLGTTDVYGLRFNLLPTHITKKTRWDQLKTLALSVSDELIPKIQMMYTAFYAEKCAFNIYVKLKYSLEDTIMFMERDNLTDFMQFVSHLAIKVDVSLIGVRNSSATLEEMVMLFATNDYYAQFIVQYLSDGTERPAEYNYNTSEEFVNNINQLFLDPYQQIMFLGGRNDPDDGFGILELPDFALKPMQRCEPVLFIQPNPFCPRIELNHSEFDINLANKRVTSLKTNDFYETLSLNLTFSKMISKKSGGSVLVCVDEYFSQLPSAKYSEVNYNGQLVVLTIVCLVCSIISLVLTFTVYCILSGLRTLPGLNNMALVFHLFFAHTLALVNAVTDIKAQWLCSAVGILLHYNLLSSFFWMFICTFHMMIVFVRIKERSTSVHTLSKFVHYLIFTESMSAILVVSNIVVSVAAGEDSVGFGYGGSSCYIQNSNMILYFVAIPLGLVLVANLALFVFVIWSVSHLPDMAKYSNHERQNILIFAKLSTLTGITYIFGFLHQFTNLLLFAFAYIVLNASQGVFIMFSFVNKRAFNMLRVRIYAKTDGHFEGTSRPVNFSTDPRNGTTNNTNTISNNSVDTK